MPNPLLANFSALDAAYNRRDWQAYADFFDDTFQGWNAKGGAAESKAAHVENAKRFCQVFANCQVHHEPYKVAISDGDWTCTLARFTGEMSGAFQLPSGRSIPATHRSFDVSLATYARWRQGKIVEEHSFVDQSELLRQAGIAGL